MADEGVKTSNESPLAGKHACGGGSSGSQGGFTRVTRGRRGGEEESGGSCHSGCGWKCDRP